MRTKKWIVTSNKREKTVTVQVNEYKMHPIYKKPRPFSKKFHAHTEEKIPEWSTVTIQETIPMSKTKRWIVTQIHNA